MTTYVYAVTSADHPLRLGGTKGVGDPAGELRALTAGRLSAVVSDAPPGLRPKRRDLLAHQTVLEQLMSDGAILPMRFGLVGRDDSDVLASLDRNATDYATRLHGIEGALEYHLKVTRDEDDLLTEIIDDVPEARRLNELTRDDPDAYREKVALGEILAREVQVRNELTGQDILVRLAPATKCHVLGEPSPAHLLSVSFLVSREKAAEFTESVHREAASRGDAFALRLSGPLPPYSFV